MSVNNESWPTDLQYWFRGM